MTCHHSRHSAWCCPGLKAWRAWRWLTRSMFVGILQVVSLPVIVSMVGGKDITYRARDDPCGHYGWEAGQPKLYCRFLWVVLHFAFEVECNLIVRCPPAGLLKSGSLVGWAASVFQVLATESSLHKEHSYSMLAMQKVWPVWSKKSVPRMPKWIKWTK